MDPQWDGPLLLPVTLTETTDAATLRRRNLLRAGATLRMHMLISQCTMNMLPTGTCIWIVAGITDMRNGFNGLASKVQNALKDNPFSGQVFIFLGRRVTWLKCYGLMLTACACGR